MKNLIASIIAFFAGTGTALEVDDNAETVTLTRDQAEQLNAGIAKVGQLETDLATARDANKTLTEDVAAVGGQLTASQTQINQFATRMGIELADGANADEAAINARIDALLALPGSAGAHAASTEDDAQAGGKKKKPLHSWEEKAAKIEERNARRNKGH